MSPCTFDTKGASVRHWGLFFASCLLVAGFAGAQPPGTATARYQPKTERGQLAGTIVRRFSPYVVRSLGVTATQWATAMQDTFGRADIQDLRLAASLTDFDDAMEALRTHSSSGGATMSPGSSAIAVGAANLVLTPVTPCRIVDTRVAGGALVAGSTRHFASNNIGGDFSAQGGTGFSDCGIPADPPVVLLRLTTINGGGYGTLTLYPYGAARPATPSLKYAGTGQLLMTEAVGNATGLAQDFSVYSTAATHLVIEIVGYYAAPPALALECQMSAETIVEVPAGGIATAFAANCPVGYTPVETKCHFYFTDDTLSGMGDGACYGRAGGSDTQLSASQKCCRVPGH